MLLIDPVGCFFVKGIINWAANRVDKGIDWRVVLLLAEYAPSIIRILRPIVWESPIVERIVHIVVNISVCEP